MTQTQNRVTLGEARRVLRLSYKTLDKWLKRLHITPERHEYDWRFYTITAEEMERIAEVRGQMPGRLPPRTAYTRRSASALDGRRSKSGETTYTDTSESALGGTSLASDATAGAQGTFASYAEAARWVVEHGVNSPLSPKSWPGWREVELTPRAVLMLMLRVYQPGNWRQQWRPRHCDRALCVCQELLPGAQTAPDPSIE